MPELTTAPQYSQTFVAPPGLRRPDWNQDEVTGCSVSGVEVDEKTGLTIHSLYGKTRRPTAEMLVPNAPPGIKFALGENVRRTSNAQSTRTFCACC